MTPFAESTVEEAALSWLADLGFAVADGPEMQPGGLFAEREGFEQVVLPRRCDSMTTPS
jgi:type I restriction enzyme R subunit